MDFEEVENGNIFDDNSSCTSSVNPSPRVNQRSDPKLTYRVVIEPESPICLHQNLLTEPISTQFFQTPILPDQSSYITLSSTPIIEERNNKLIKELLNDEFGLVIDNQHFIPETVNIQKTKRPSSIRTQKLNPATCNQNQTYLQKAMNQKNMYNRTSFSSNRSGSAPLSRSKPPKEVELNIIRHLEKAMETLYSTKEEEPNQIPVVDICSLEKQVVLETNSVKKQSLKILIENSNNIEYVKDRKKVKYEGIKIYNLNRRIDIAHIPKRVDSEKLLSPKELTVWEKLKVGTANLKKRIELMKSSLQRSGSQLRVESILGGTSSNNLLIASTSSSSKLMPMVEYKRTSTKRELTKQKGISPDIFNENSSLCKIFNLLSDINNKEKIKVKWCLKKKYKVMIAQEKARKREANLRGIYDNRKRLTRFQMQAVLNTVHPARIAPEMELLAKIKNTVLTNNPTLRTNSPNMENSVRNSSVSVNYHEKNREDIMKHLNVIENLNSTLFSNQEASRKVKFGDQKTDSPSQPTTKRERRQSIVSNFEIKPSEIQPKNRPQSAPLKKQSESAKKNLQDVMIEKELSKQKKAALKPKKSLYALATTFSETKLKLFNPYSSNMKESDEIQSDNTRKNKNKGNSLVTEFQKMVLQENGSSSGLNRSIVSELEDAPRDLFDFSSVNPFDAVKTLNLTKQPTNEMTHIGKPILGELTQGKEDQATYKKKPRLKPPLDTGLKKVKKDPQITEGMVCSIGNFTLS